MDGSMLTVGKKRRDKQLPYLWLKQEEGNKKTNQQPAHTGDRWDKTAGPKTS